MQLRLIKKADDMSLGKKTIRISIGGQDDLAYITYRGDLEEAQTLLTAVSAAFSRLKPDMEPPISPDDGKHYA